MEGELRRVRGLIEEVKELVRYFKSVDEVRNVYLMGKMKNAIAYLAVELNKLYHSHGKGPFRELARELVEDHDVVTALARHFWNERLSLTRGAAHLFHELLRNIKEKGDPKRYKDVLPEIALLSMAAYHDIPTVKRLEDRDLYLVKRVVENFEDPFYVLGRRPLKAFLDRIDVIRRYYELTPKKVERYLNIRKEDLENISKELGRNVSWPEYLLLQLDKEIEGKIDLRSYNIHPHERLFLKPYLHAYFDKIDEELRRAKGKEFFEYKFREHADMIEEIHNMLETLNGMKNNYRYEIPQDFVSHLHAQVIPPACTSWNSYILEILHGPFIPIVLKDKEGRIVGRIFLALGRDREGKYYLVHGDYEGKRHGREHFEKEIIPLLKDISKKHLGTELIHYSGASGIGTTHHNPWIAV